MKHTTIKGVGCLLVAAAVGLPTASAAKGKTKAEPEVPLSATGQQLEAKYAATLAALQAEVAKTLPAIAEQRKAVLQQAHAVTKAAEGAANTALQSAGKIQTAKALVEHAKGKWIGGAEKGIAQAEAALKKATTDTQRDAAKKDLAKWQKNKEDGLKALKERQAAYEKAKTDETKAGQANQAAQAALAKARSNELNAAQALLAEAGPFLASDKLDGKLVKCTVLAEATPRGLAEFAQQGKEQEALVEKLLADDKLMKDMLMAGGAKFGKYGRAMEIYAAIQQASPKAREGFLQRLALATALEHAVPIKQSNPADQPTAPATGDPVKRYLHYENAFLDGELDPAFKNFSAWEYRMVIDCDAPDQILAWGREMLRNYRPDHIYNPNYGWRYSAAVKTDVKYGSQNVKDDLPSQQQYQNIIKNGGVCGRRAFFGRFILKSFGIPTWGVTQKAHAALSHWTPQGWVVNLGAGFAHSWWDKDEAPRSGSDFLLETQAREHAQEYLKVLRAQWVSRVLGEPAYNERKKIDGDFWSNLGHYQTVVLASQAVALGPLGQELAEANESAATTAMAVVKATVTDADKQMVIAPNGVITIPAAACTGSVQPMKSFLGGFQAFCGGPFSCSVDTPRPGKYQLTARVVTVRDEGPLHVAVNKAKDAVVMVIPYTCGRWAQTKPVEVTLVAGKNVLSFANLTRGLTCKDITLTPVR
jgi:hypothetical protein